MIRVQRKKHAIIITNQKEFDIIKDMFMEIGAICSIEQPELDRLIKHKLPIAWNSFDHLTYCDVEYWKKIGFQVLPASYFIMKEEDNYEIL